jgi:hypothetical protein
MLTTLTNDRQATVRIIFLEKFHAWHGVIFGSIFKPPRWISQALLIVDDFLTAAPLPDTRTTFFPCPPRVRLLDEYLTHGTLRF